MEATREAILKTVKTPRRGKEEGLGTVILGSFVRNAEIQHSMSPPLVSVE